MAHKLPPPFFTIQDHRLRGAMRWNVPKDGSECFAELVKAAGGKDALIEQSKTGEWTDEVLHAWCLYCGMGRDLYEPLDPYGKNPPRIWKTKWVGEFVDWYTWKFPDEVVVSEEDEEKTEEIVSEQEPAKKKRGRTKKEVVTSN